MDIRTQPSALSAHVVSDELSLTEVVGTLWSRRWLLLAVILVALSGAAAAIALMPKTYAASILLSPDSSTLGSSRLDLSGSPASRLGSLASLAGFTVPTDTRKAESIAMLGSRVLTEEYIRQNDLLPVLFPEKWDAVRRQWKVASPRDIPTLWEADQKFKGIRTISLDPKTGLVTLTMKWRDPAVAAAWANGLVRLTNDYLRSKAIAQSERNIAYLNDQAARTNVVESRQAIAALLESEINKVMVARGSEEYAFKVLDPAVAPERPTIMKDVVVVLGALAIVLASVLMVLVRAG